MKIAAFYIPKGRFPDLFGKGHEEITINFGGKHLYQFRKAEIWDVTPNPYYLDDLLSKNISLFSCIVGNNGSGKTTLLHQIANSYDCQYVIERNGGNEFEVVDNIEHIHRVYYSPYLHHKTFDSVRNNSKELSKYAMISLDNHGDSGLLENFMKTHHSENMKRWVAFNHFYKQQEFPKVSLPVFSTVDVLLNHFDYNTIHPNKFNDTSAQLREPIKQILQKLKGEQEEKIKIIRDQDKPTGKKAKKIQDLIRFEFELYHILIGKLVSILERKGNDYLREGYIPDDYQEQIAARNVRESILWFLENAGVFAGNDKYSFSAHISGVELIDYILSITTEESFTDNWRKIHISQNQAYQIIQRYEAFNNSFINEWFDYDKTPMFFFTPDIVISSGEQAFLNLFSLLFYHAQNIRNKVDVDYHTFDSISKIGKDILLLIDEGDNAFHPQWKKEYVKYIRDTVPIIFEGYNIQIIITSHDPLTLSDFPKNNVVFMQKENGRTKIGTSSSKLTLGANVSDLLKDSFFINDGQIGSFIAGVLDNIINRINNKLLDENQIQEIQRIIQALDEPILKFKLAEMLSNATGNEGFEKQLIDDEIHRLTQRRRSL